MNKTTIHPCDLYAVTLIAMIWQTEPNFALFVTVLLFLFSLFKP